MSFLIYEHVNFSIYFDLINFSLKYSLIISLEILHISFLYWKSNFSLRSPFSSCWYFQCNLRTIYLSSQLLPYCISTTSLSSFFHTNNLLKNRRMIGLEYLTITHLFSLILYSHYLRITNITLPPIWSLKTLSFLVYILPIFPYIVQF